MNPPKRARKTPFTSKFAISEDCLGNAFKFLSFFTLFRIMCVSSIFNKNAHKILSKIHSLPTNFEFSGNTSQKMRSIKKHCRGLKCLSMLDPSASVDGFQSKIEDLAVSLRGLTRIFYRCPNGKSPTDQFLTNISSMLPKIETLALACDGDISIDLLQCKNLKTIYMSRATFSEKHLASFLNRTPTLESLLFLNLPCTNMFATVGMLHNIRNISLCPYDDDTVIDFRTAQTMVEVMKNLEQIVLTTCEFGAPGLLELLKLDKLNDLRIGMANLEDFPSGVVKVSMKVFWAWRCLLDDRCIGRIAYAFPNLENLDIHYNPAVTQDGLKQLDVLKLTKLQA